MSLFTHSSSLRKLMFVSIQICIGSKTKFLESPPLKYALIFSVSFMVNKIGLFISQKCSFVNFKIKMLPPSSLLTDLKLFMFCSRGHMGVFFAASLVVHSYLIFLWKLKKIKLVFCKYCFRVGLKFLDSSKVYNVQKLLEYLMWKVLVVYLIKYQPLDKLPR